MTTMMVLLEVAGMVALAKMGAAFAASIAVVGVQALDAIARQPEASGDVRSSMIVAAALIEGLAFFAIIVAMLVLFLA